MTDRGIRMMTPGTDDPRRGEIWLAALGKGRRGEPGKNRPVVVVSPSALGPYKPTDLVTVVPLTASASRSPARIPLAARPGLLRDSLAVPRAVRAVARGRLLRQLSCLDPSELAAVEAALAMSLGLA